jgi:hypothetical protein
LNSYHFEILFSELSKLLIAAVIQKFSGFIPVPPLKREGPRGKREGRGEEG